MSAATTTHDLSHHETSFVERVQAPVTGDDDLSPRMLRNIYLGLLAGAVFLAGVAAYVWHGTLQWLTFA